MVLACQVRNVPTNRSRDACFVGLTGRAIPVHHQRQHYHRTQRPVGPGGTAGLVAVGSLVLAEGLKPLRAMVVLLGYLTLSRS